MLRWNAPKEARLGVVACALNRLKCIPEMPDVVYSFACFQLSWWSAVEILEKLGLGGGMPGGICMCWSKRRVHGSVVEGGM
jgi:hypothetical protein